MNFLQSLKSASMPKINPRPMTEKRALSYGSNFRMSKAKHLLRLIRKTNDCCPMHSQNYGLSNSHVRKEYALEMACRYLLCGFLLFDYRYTSAEEIYNFFHQILRFYTKVYNPSNVSESKRIFDIFIDYYQT